MLMIKNCKKKGIVNLTLITLPIDILLYYSKWSHLKILEFYIRFSAAAESYKQIPILSDF